MRWALKLQDIFSVTIEHFFALGELTGIHDTSQEPLLMRVQVRVDFHRLDNVVHRSVCFVVLILVLLILPGWSVGGLLYPRLPEIM